MARIAYPYDPDDLEAFHPPFVQDLIELKRQGHHDAVGEIIKMIAALKQLGLECGFTKKLHDSPLYELKTHMRGGRKGGARAYLFRAPRDTFMICRAESKTGNDANEESLEDAAYILLAFKQGKPVFPNWLKKKVTHEKKP
jgi:hypothetical protein